jgi:hypothetical protein
LRDARAAGDLAQIGLRAKGFESRSRRREDLDAVVARVGALGVIVHRRNPILGKRVT